ncbi:MAG: Ig-like domain-containing protein [Gemmatimonadota bacterium]
MNDSTTMARLAGVLGLALAAGIAACTSDSEGPADPGPPDPEPVATVELTPHLAELEVGMTFGFAAVTLDSTGAVLQNRSIAWTSADPGVASVDSDGLATAVAPGSTSITATSEGIADTATLIVEAVPVVGVAVLPPDTLIEVGQVVQLAAEARDAAGEPLAGRTVVWSSLDPSVATVSDDGLVEAVGLGDVSIQAEVEAVTGTSLLTVVHAAATLVGAGDIADCATPWDEATANLLDGIPGIVFTAGDNAYEEGTAEEYANCYGPSWGRHKDRTYPATGNHEYHSPDAAPHFEYFGAAAGDPDKGYYSYEAGAWKVIVLNSNAGRVPVGEGSQQEQWLRDELAASDHACTLAYWHHPRFSSGVYGDDDRFDAFWQALYEYGAELVVVGHEHHYERLAPLNPAGELDPAAGIRQIIAGTGGRYLRPTGIPRTGSEVRNSETFGVLELTLRYDSYDWEFIPVAGQTFTDAGSGVCH